jgi:hypothetical protein
MVRIDGSLLIVIVAMLAMILVAEAGKPKQKGLIPGSIGTFLSNSN